MKDDSSRLPETSSLQNFHTICISGSRICVTGPTLFCVFLSSQLQYLAITWLYWVSLPQNNNSVIIYLPSCCWKTMIFHSLCKEMFSTMSKLLFSIQWKRQKSENLKKKLAKLNLWLKWSVFQSKLSSICESSFVGKLWPLVRLKNLW